MSINRFFKEDKGAPDPITVDNIFLQADSASWRKPYIISIERIGDAIQLRIDEDTL